MATTANPSNTKLTDNSADVLRCAVVVTESHIVQVLLIEQGFYLKPGQYKSTLFVC